MPNNRDIPLDNLAVFLTVVSTGGFRSAAKRLDMAPSTVSETISRLEAGIGTPLLSRTTRAVMATEAGRALADRIEPLIADARSALEDAATSAQVVRGPLRLNVPGAVMGAILPPLIDRFLDLYPEVTVELLVDDRFIDGIAAGCHAGIRYGEALEQDMIAVPIGPRQQQGALAAAPAYLAQRGRPQHPEALMDHDCVRMRFSSGALTPWEFEWAGEIIAVDPPARLTISTTAATTAVHHAVAGRGLIYTFRNWLEPCFADGSLVPVLQEWWPTFDGPNLYFSSRFMPSPLRAFVDMIAEDRKRRPSE